MSSFVPTERTKLSRLPKRAEYSREAIYQILDEGFVCHLGFQVNDQPYVIPTSYGRKDDTLYIHGSAASRMLLELQKGIEACVTVTLLDGLVLARSAFHHSINYRSVVAFGTARVITGPEEKAGALTAIVEHIIPGRTRDARGPSEAELNATTVLEFPLEEVSAKIRTGPPIDDEEDYALPVWAGVIPLRLQILEPVADPRLAQEIQPPEYVLRYTRKR